MRTSFPGYFAVSIILAVLISATGCSSDDPVSPNGTENYFWVHFGDDSTKIMFSSMPVIDADGEEAIQLDEFVSTSMIPMFVDKQGTSYDARVLYSYQIVGEDGFSASTHRGYLNNIWNHLQLGHVMKETRQVVFPDTKIDIAGAYNIKSALHLYIYRKFDVTIADSTTFVEIRTITPVTVTNTDNAQEEAIHLKEIITALLSAPQALTFNITALDGFGPSMDMTWPEFQSGYWLLTSETTMFTDTSLAGGSYKLKVLDKILVIP